MGYFPFYIACRSEQQKKGWLIFWQRELASFHPRHWKRDQCLSCPFSIGNPSQIALRCSLCISYLHWINVSHWWQVFKSMFINGFFKCLKIKSLTYWWSFRSCPGREKELELERVWRAAELTPAAKKQEAEGGKEEEPRVSWEQGIRRSTHRCKVSSVH